MLSMIVAPRSVASLLCLIGTAQGLSLLHSKDSRFTSVSVAFGEDGPPGAEEVNAILNNINSSLDQVGGVVTAANSTAYSVAGQLLDSIATMQDGLAALSTAADAAAQVPGAADVATQASNFIDKANSTLQKAQAKVPATLDKISTKFAGIVPGFAKLAVKATAKYEDAMSIIVGDICNSTGQNLYKKLVRKMQKWKTIQQTPKAHQKSEKTHRHARKTGDKAEAVALLEARVHQHGKPVGASNVEEAIWSKGGKSPTAKATGEISKANATVQSLSDKIAEANATIAELLATRLDVAFEALDSINASVAPLLADLPESLAQPVSSALDRLLSKRESLQSEVQSQLSEVAAGIQDAIASLEEVAPLADLLQSAVDECSNSESTAESGAAESNSTTEASTDDGNDTAAEPESGSTTEASTDDGNGTASS